MKSSLLKMKTLRIALLIDFLLAFAFGIISFITPQNTFGTIVEIPVNNKELFLALLSSLSIFYIIIGLVCLVGTRLTNPYISWVSAIMLVRHLWVGIIGMLDAEKSWVIGNPYYDIFIHSGFVVVYTIGILVALKIGK